MLQSSCFKCYGLGRVVETFDYLAVQWAGVGSYKCAGDPGLQETMAPMAPGPQDPRTLGALGPGTPGPQDPGTPTPAAAAPAVQALAVPALAAQMKTA